MQIFTCQEHGSTGVVLRDAKTGETIWRVPNGRDENAQPRYNIIDSDMVRLK